MHRLFTVIGFIGAVLLVLKPREALARPYDVVIRHKRVSDQRLAELETLVALSNMKGRLVTVPVGFGQVDPAKIGRRRRSIVAADEGRILKRSHQMAEIEANQDSNGNRKRLVQFWIELLQRNGNGRSENRWN